MSNSPFFQPSNRAAGFNDETVEAPSMSATVWAAIKDRFETCPDGLSFAVEDIAGLSEKGFRTLVSRMCKKHDKRYRVIKHDSDHLPVVYELYRLPLERAFIGSGDASTSEPGAFDLASALPDTLSPEAVAASGWQPNPTPVPEPEPTWRAPQATYDRLAMLRERAGPGDAQEAIDLEALIERIEAETKAEMEKEVE